MEDSEKIPEIEDSGFRDSADTNSMWLFGQCESPPSVSISVRVPGQPLTALGATRGYWRFPVDFGKLMGGHAAGRCEKP